jgi:hypothetical protein
MSGIIYDNQPCYWTTSTSATAQYPTDTVGGAGAVASSLFRSQYKNAIVMTVMVSHTAAATATLDLAEGTTNIATLTTPAAGSYMFQLGGDVGTFAAGGFNIRTSAGTVQVWWRPQ